MKSSYEVRAAKFAAVLACLFAGCSTVDDFEFAVECYNDTHTRKLTTAHGVSRFVVIRSDYVIKFDMVPQGRWSDGSAGCIASEERVYARAVADNMAHLLAKLTVGEAYGRKYAIMFRICGVDDGWRWWADHCTREEAYWLEDNVGDLHEGNVGYRHGKVCVIDYAWDEVEDRTESAESSSYETSPFSGFQY